MQPVDLVLSGQLTKEESQLTAWGLTYKVSLAALDALQHIVTEVDQAGGPLFDVTALQRTETQRRRVIDLNAIAPVLRPVLRLFCHRSRRKHLSAVSRDSRLCDVKLLLRRGLNFVLSLMCIAHSGRIRFRRRVRA